MSLDDLQRYWALLAAGALALVVLVFVMVRVYQDSARGRLTAQLRALREREKAARKAAGAARESRRRLEKLRVKADSVKPRLVEETKGKLEDALALKKIADDKVLIARNHVRKTIIEEFPPKEHESMRRRLLPEAGSDGRPFTIES